MPPASGVPPTGGAPPVAQPGAAFGMVSLFLSLPGSPFFIQKPTHTALIYSPQQEQAYPWCPSSQLCMGSLWWGHHLELPLALVYRWVLVLDECLTVIRIARRELCVHYLSSNSSCRFVNGISCSVSCLTCNWSHELPWFFFYFVLLLFIRPMEQVQKVSCT